MAIKALMLNRTKLAGILQAGKKAASGLPTRAVPSASGSDIKERSA
jgi:hypothetical protein